MSREERVEIWRSGIALSESWLRFGDERQLKKQREKRGTPAALVYQRLMLADILGQLASERLLAYGYQIAPVVSDGPTRVPSDLFDSEPVAFGEADIVRVAGVAFEHVRVLSPGKKVPETLAIPITPDDLGSLTEITDNPRRGPTGSQELLAATYENLLSTGAIPIDHTVKGAWGIVLRYLDDHPELKPRGGRGLSYPSFARALSTKCGA